MERKEEIDLNEGNRLLDQIKAEYNEDKEGYIRRVLMTGGRDPDEELESKEASQEKNGGCSNQKNNILCLLQNLHQVKMNGWKWNPWNLTRKRRFSFF